MEIVTYVTNNLNSWSILQTIPALTGKKIGPKIFVTKIIKNRESCHLSLAENEPILKRGRFIYFYLDNFTISAGGFSPLFF